MFGDDIVLFLGLITGKDVYMFESQSQFLLTIFVDYCCYFCESTWAAETWLISENTLEITRFWILMLKGLCAYSPQCQVWLQIRDSHEAKSTFCFIFDKADQSVAIVIVSFRKFIFQGLTQTSADIKLQTKLDIHWEVWFYNVPFSFVLSGIDLFTFLLCYTFLFVFFYCSDRNSFC